MQSGSSSRSGRDQEQQLKCADASDEQQLKRTQSGGGGGGGGGGGEADAIVKQQLCTQSCPAPDIILMVGERGGSS